MSDQPLPESEGSTLDSSAPGCRSLGNAKPTPSAEKSSADIGPEPRALMTCELFVLGVDCLTPEDAQRFRVYNGAALAPSLSAEKGRGHGAPTLLISSAADSLVKTSASPADAQGSTVSEAGCSSSSPELPMTLFGTEGGSSLRTYPDFFPAKADEISPSFLRRWPTSGFTTSPGECWTADTSECPSGGGEFSSLPDVLEEQVPERFYLSPRAAAGILRRAEKRGRELPQHLESALRALSEQNPAAVRQPTSTDTERMLPDGGKKTT